MPEFFNVLPPNEALRTLLNRLTMRVEREVVATVDAVERVTAADIIAPEDLPAFARSTMDGYSVRAVDTFGASDALPAYLDVVGDVPMGSGPVVSLGLGHTARAYTGGMPAHNADAVVMVENTQDVDERSIEVLRPVAPGENVVQPGEDVRRGDVVLPAGRVVRPQDVGGLLALGITEVKVARRPRVAIVSTGDELVPPSGSPNAGQVRDINTYTLSELVRRAGGEPIVIGIAPDTYEAQRRAALDGLSRADMLVFSAGSSVSNRDLTAGVLSSLGEPGILVHGIAHKPGKPTIVAMAQGTPCFGLPGNPVSAMIVFGILVRPTIYAMMGCVEPPRPATIAATLTHNIASVAGREDHVPVRLFERDGRRLAEPVFGKSNLIYTLVRADGVVVAPMDKGGLYEGETVDVRLF